MESSEDKIEVGGLWLTLKLSRILGLTPLCQYRGSILRTCVYYAHLIYRFVLLIILNTFSICLLLVDVIQDVRNTTHFVVSTTSRVQFVMWLFHVALTIIITDVGAWTGRNRLTRIREFHVWMKKSNFKLHGNNKWREMRRILFGLMLLGMVIIMQSKDTANYIDMISKGDKDVIVLYLYGSYQLLSVGAIILLLEFTFLMYTYHSAMESLNGKLHSILISIRHGEPLTSAEDDSLRDIGTAYIFIAESLDLFNKMDGSVLLLIFMFAYEAVVIKSYIIIQNVLHSARNGAPFYMITVMWLLIIIVLMAFLVEPSHQFLKEVDRMRTLMAKLMYQTTCPGEATVPTLRVCCNKLVVIRPAFAPLGLFDLTRSLLTKIISTTITCLVFIAQSQIKTY